MNSHFHGNQSYGAGQQRGYNPPHQEMVNVEDDDEEMNFDTPGTNFVPMSTTSQETPKQPVLVRYEVAQNIFEVPDRYKLHYAIGQGAYGIVWYAFFLLFL